MNRYSPWEVASLREIQKASYTAGKQESNCCGCDLRKGRAQPYLVQPDMHTRLPAV